MLCPLISITPNVPDNAIGIPNATQKATLPDKNKNKIITTKINPPSPFLISKLINASKIKSGARVFLHKVKKPGLFGVAKVNSKNKILGIKEKPKKYYSNLAITGLYFFDNKVIKYSKDLKPSKRNELEITDLLKKYHKNNQLNAEFIGRGGKWLDAGSIEDYYNTTKFVSTIENRQGFKIGCLEEVALNNKWITKKNIISAIKFYGNCGYSNYLKKLF